MNKICTFLLVSAAVLLLALSACNNAPEIIVQTVVVKETVVVTATASMTPVPTLTPWPTFTPTPHVQPTQVVISTSNPCLSNVVEEVGDVILPECEDRLVQVRFVSSPFGGILQGSWQDSSEETWVYAFNQFLSDTDGGHYVSVEMKVHLNDHVGQNGLPNSLGDFGPESDSWVLDMSFGSGIQAWDGAELSGRRFAVKLLEGEVASVLVATGFAPNGLDVEYETFYFTVIGGEILSLEPLRTGFESLGATVLFYSVGCNDVEACAYFTSRLTGMAEGGDARGGRYLVFSPEQVSVKIDWLYQKRLRNVDIIKVQ